jgi:hypothetical protein
VVIVKTPSSVIPPWYMPLTIKPRLTLDLSRIRFDVSPSTIEVRVGRILGRCTSVRTDFFTL